MTTTAASALRTALDLHEAGVELMRQNLRRRDPSATDDEIDRRLRAWLADRPGAPFGDCTGPGFVPRT